MVVVVGRGDSQPARHSTSGAAQHSTAPARTGGAQSRTVGRTDPLRIETEEAVVGRYGQAGEVIAVELLAVVDWQVANVRYGAVVVVGVVIDCHVGKVHAVAAVAAVAEALFGLEMGRGGGNSEW
jgi:hypothetical protein